MKKCVERLWVDTGAEDDEEFGEPGRVRGPSRRGDEVAVGDGFGHGEIDVGATCLRDVRSDRRISAAPSSFEDTCRGEDLCRMADGGDRFVRLCEMMDDFDDARDEANIFGCATSGEDQGVVLLGLDLIEGGVKREVVATLFGVGLIALEIVDGGADGFARFFAGTDGVDGGADHQQRLERDHVSVVFDVIADQHENGFLRHRGLRNWKRVTEIKMPTERPRLHHEWKSATSRVGATRDEPRPNCRGLRLAEDAESAGRRREGPETGRGARIDTSRTQNKNCPSGDWRGRARWWRGLIL